MLSEHLQFLSVNYRKWSKHRKENELLQILCDERPELYDVCNYLSIASDCEKDVRHNLGDRLITAGFTGAHVEYDERKWSVFYS